MNQFALIQEYDVTLIEECWNKLDLVRCTLIPRWCPSQSSTNGFETTAIGVRDMTLPTAYIATDSWVHQLDPRVKCLWVIVVGATGFIVPNFGWIAMSIGLLVPIVISAKCMKRWLALVAIASIPAWLIAAINMFWGNSVIPSGHVPDRLALDWLYPLVTGDPEPFLLLKSRFLWWDIVLTTASFEMGLYFAFRWINIVAPAVLFIFTTRPEDFAASLSQLKLPYVFVFLVAVAVRFFPIFARDTRLVYDAQRSRGAKVDGGVWPVRLLVMFRMLLFPVLISALHHAHNMSLGMEVRGFHTGRHRTTFMQKRLCGADYSALAVCIALLTGSVLVRVL